MRLKIDPDESLKMPIFGIQDSTFVFLTRWIRLDKPYPSLSRPYPTDKAYLLIRPEIPDTRQPCMEIILVLKQGLWGHKVVDHVSLDRPSCRKKRETALAVPFLSNSFIPTIFWQNQSFSTPTTIFQENREETKYKPWTIESQGVQVRHICNTSKTTQHICN